MKELRVLDGRNPHKVANVITITDYEIVAEYSSRWEDERALCLKIGGKYVPAAEVHNDRGYDYILIKDYKTIKGVEKWVERFL